MILNKFKIKKTLLKNRVFISPMCQYSSKNGNPSSWHYKHLLNLCSSGASMIILESTAIDRNGRISPADLCLYNNNHRHNNPHHDRHSISRPVVARMVLQILGPCKFLATL